MPSESLYLWADTMYEVRKRVCVWIVALYE